MPATRHLFRLSCCSALALGAIVLTPGCGDSGPAPGATVYSSPEEQKEKNRGLQDAMKGGAYGSAGRKSANMIQ